MDPPVFVPMPGFTTDQTVYVRAYIWSSIQISMDWKPTLNAAFNEYFGLPPLQPLPPLRNLWPQQSTPPAPQEAPKEQAILEEDTEITAEKQEPLYQATVEDDTEDGNNMLVNKSKLSSFSCLCTTRSSGDPAACLSNLLAVLFGSLFGSTSFFGSFLASQLGYIRCMASMEASGEG